MEHSLNLPELISTIESRYVVSGDRLYRKLATGGLAEVKALTGGKLSLVICGKLYQAAQVAWTLHYGMFPTCRLVSFDSDVTNVAADNLYPIVTKQFRWRVTYSGDLYYHPLNKRHGFRTMLECRKDWDNLALRTYKIGKTAVLHREAIQRNLLGELPRHYGKLDRPKQPLVDPGFIACWYKNSRWVVVPEAKHVSDDIMERTRHYLQGRTWSGVNPKGISEYD